jgi:DNA replication protein DnaC
MEDQDLLRLREQILKQQANIPESVKCSRMNNQEAESSKNNLPVFKENTHSQCEMCGSEVEVIVSPLTSTVITYCPACSEKEEREQESIHMKAVRKKIAEKIEMCLRKRGVPRRFLNAKISDFPVHWQKLTENEEGIFLTGSRGVGKTHLAVALMREMILATRPLNHSGTYRIDLHQMPLFISVPELLLQIRDTYRSNEPSEKAVIDKYSWVDVLILDDLGVQKPSDWVLQILYIIMDRRYREELRTIITSNMSIEEVQENFDDRIASRIAGMCRVCIVQGKDKRVRHERTNKNNG